MLVEFCIALGRSGSPRLRFRVGRIRSSRYLHPTLPQQSCILPERSLGRRSRCQGRFDNAPSTGQWRFSKFLQWKKHPLSSPDEFDSSRKTHIRSCYIYRMNLQLYPISKFSIHLKSLDDGSECSKYLVCETVSNILPMWHSWYFSEVRSDH